MMSTINTDLTNSNTEALERFLESIRDATVKQVNEPLPDDYSSVSTVRTEPTEASFKQVNHPISENIDPKNRVLVVDGGSRETLRRLQAELADFAYGRKQFKPKKQKTPTTPADLEALEKARIKRETKQAKRVK